MLPLPCYCNPNERTHEEKSKRLRAREKREEDSVIRFVRCILLDPIVCPPSFLSVLSPQFAPRRHPLMSGGDESLFWPTSSSSSHSFHLILERIIFSSYRESYPKNTQPEPLCNEGTAGGEKMSAQNENTYNHWRNNSLPALRSVSLRSVVAEEFSSRTRKELSAFF